MALQFVRGQLIDAIINADKLDASSVQEAKIQDEAVAFAKLKGADVTSDLQSSATSSQIARADAIKQYVDDEIADLSNNDWKEGCVGSTTATLSGTYNNGSGTITASANGAFDVDGITASSLHTFSAGDRILVRHTTSAGATATENCGIYNITTLGDGSNPFVLTRATDMNTAAEIRGSAILVKLGTVNGGRSYYVPSFAGILGTDNVVFERFRQFSAGSGLEFTDTNGAQDVMSLDIKSASGLKITGVELDLGLDGSTLAQSASGVKVADGGITATQIATSVAGSGLAGGGGTALSVGVDDSSIQITGDTINVKALGVTNEMLAGSIANAKLANSTISGVALGANLNSLSPATNGGVLFSTYDGSAAVSNLQLDVSDLADATVNVANDSIAIYDADADVTGKESIAHLIQAVAGSGLSDSSGVLSVGIDDSSIALNGSDQLIVKALGVTNAMLAGSIADSKLNTITTGNKVSGSAVQLASGGGLADDSGLKVDTNGIETAMIGDAQVTHGKLADDSVKLDKLGILPSTDDFTANGSTASFTLSNRIAADQIANFKQMVRVFRNGQRLKPVASSPSDASEYTVADSGSATVVTLGANPANGEVIIVDYWYNAS